MRRKSVLLTVILAGAASLGADSPKLQMSWKNPTASGGRFTNIMVLAVNGKAEGRADFEDAMVNSLSRPGVQATASYEFLPRPDATPIDINELKAIVREQKFDAIVVARLTKADQKTTYVPGQVYAPFPYYGTIYGYYRAVYPVVYSLGYLKNEKKAQVEVNLYSTAKPDGELVWTGTTNTFDSSSVKKLIKNLVKLVTKELEKQSIIDRSSK